MSEWKKVKLGEVSLCIQPGPFGTQLHNSDYTDQGIPVIMPKDMTDGRVSHAKLEHISEDTANRISRHKVDAGDIIVARKGDVRKCIYIRESEEGWITGSDCLKMQLNQRICNSKFIFYQLRSPYIGAWLQKVSKGATMPSLNTTLLSNIEIVFPPIPAQNSIAEILSRYDSLIENYQKQIKLLEEAAQRLYKEWFVDLHFPGYENTKIVDGVPEGWEKKKIADVCTNISSGSTPSRSNKAYWENGTIKWVKTKELQDGWIIDTEEYISQEGYNSSSTKIFPVNTILMAIYASPTLGRLGILSTDCCCNQAALGLIADENIISWQWLFWKLYELRDEFNAIARGAGQQNISGIVVKNKEIVIPDKGVIDGFTSVVSKMFEQQKSLFSQIRLLTEARDRLLPNLMVGEVILNR